MATSKIKSSASFSEWKESETVTVPANSGKWVMNFTKPVILMTTNQSCIPFVAFIGGTTMQGYLHNFKNTEQTAALRYKEIN